MTATAIEVNAGTKWRQIANAPFVLPGANVEAASDERRFIIDSENWTEWHIPMPGIVGLRLADGVDPNLTIELFGSNGSGLLAPASLVYDEETELWIDAPAIQGIRVLHARARSAAVTAEAFYLAKESRPLPIGARMTADGPTVSIRRHRLSSAEQYVELTPGRRVVFDVATRGAARIRIRVPFAGVPRPWVDHRLTIEADQRLLESPSFRAIQDIRQVFLVGGTKQLLSRIQDHYVNLPKDAKSLSLSATHRVFVKIDEVLARPFLLPELNDPNHGRAATTDGTTQQALVTRIEEQRSWQHVIALATNNLTRAAPLQTADALARNHDDLVRGRFRERIFSRYTELFDLIPAARMQRSATTDARHHSDATVRRGVRDYPDGSYFEARYAEYRMPKLLSPEETNADRWLGAAQLTIAANRAPGAWFLEVEAGETIEFPLPSYPYATRMRVVANHRHSAAGTPFELFFSGTTGTTLAHHSLMLDERRVLTGRHDPAGGRSWSKGFARMTADAIGAIETTVPPEASAVRLANRGASTLLVALQLRIPAYHQHREPDWVKLLGGGQPPVLQLWWQAWESSRDEPNSNSSAPWRAAMANRAVDSVVLNGWIPVLHYLSEQLQRFEPRTDIEPRNLHCASRALARDSEKVREALFQQGDSAVAEARHWQTREQWLNATEAWQAALPSLADAPCIEAHLALTQNLVVLGEHLLAEDYLRTLLLDTRNIALRDAAIEALGTYYRDQSMPYANVQLTAYVAMRWRQSSALLDLSHALFDAGHDRFGVEVALLNPESRRDERLTATLNKLGWQSVLELLGRDTGAREFDEPDDVLTAGCVNVRDVSLAQCVAQAQSAADLRAHERIWHTRRLAQATARLRVLRTAPIEDLRFGASAVITDVLFDEPRIRPLATPTKPITFSIAGPVKLRLSLRPIADPIAANTSQSWAIVRIDDKRFPVPVDLNTAFSRYVVLDEQLVVGAATQREFDLGPGLHQIRIDPEAWALATAIHTLSPWHRRLREAPLLTDAMVRVLADPMESWSITAPNEFRQPAPPAPVFLPVGESEWQKLLQRHPSEAGPTRELMAALTYIADYDVPRRAHAAARAEWLAHDWAHDRKISRLRTRLRRSSNWQSNHLVGASAGTQLATIEGFQPESEYWRVRNLFLPIWKPGEQRLGSGATVADEMSVPTPTDLKLTMQHLSTRRLPAPEIDLAIRRQGQQTPTRHTLADGATKSLVMHLDRGGNRWDLELSRFPSTSIVKLEIAESKLGEWQVLKRPIRRRYHLADQNQPVQFEFQGPAWLRIDEVTSRGVTQRYAYLSAGERLEAIHGKSAEATRLRAFQRVVTESDRPATAFVNNTPEATRLPATNTTPAVRPSTEGTAAAVSLAAPLLPMMGNSIANKRPELSRPVPATYSGSVAWLTDDEAQEDSRRPVREYWETTLSRRQRNARLDRFQETTVLARTRDIGNPSVGATFYHWRKIEDTPFNVRGDLRLYAQNIQSGTAWSSHGQLAVRHFTRGTGQLRHRSELKLIARYLSESQGSSALDPDIFTPYMADHRSGFELGHRISLQRYWDSEIYGDVRLRSNEFFHPTPDYLRGIWGGRAQLGVFQVGAELQVTRYFRDGDRTSATTIPRVKLRGRWYGPATTYGWIEVRTELRYDIDDGEPSGTIRLLWHFDRGQGLTDFHAERHWFDPLINDRLTGAWRP
ncbi:MAG: hypothetical protein O7H39_01285 [Gammaproteobacteria bacterium]|nr:hypothetical protein [Gammaproteobacteria bacterium]